TGRTVEAELFLCWCLLLLGRDVLSQEGGDPDGECESECALHAVSFGSDAEAPERTEANNANRPGHCSLLIAAVSRVTVRDRSRTLVVTEHLPLRSGCCNNRYTGALCASA